MYAFQLVERGTTIYQRHTFPRSLWGHDLEVMHITYAHILLSRIRSHCFTQLQGRLWKSSAGQPPKDPYLTHRTHLPSSSSKFGSLCAAGSSPPGPDATIYFWWLLNKEKSYLPSLQLHTYPICTSGKEIGWVNQNFHSENGRMENTQFIVMIKSYHIEVTNRPVPDHWVSAVACLSGS